MSEETILRRACWMLNEVRHELDTAINCMMNGRNIEAGIRLEAARYKARDFEIELGAQRLNALSDEEEVSE